MPKTITRFEELLIWQKANALALEIYRLSQNGNFARDFALRDQIRKAAISVVSNIAEGFERYSRPEFRQFLSIVRGSAAEIRAQLILAQQLGYFAAGDYQKTLELSVEVSKRIGTFRTSLSS